MKGRWLTKLLSSALVLNLSVPLVGGEGAPSLPVAPTASAPATTAAPKIEFTELTHDFGQVKEGEQVRLGFVFRNVGTSPLEITEVKPGCGCTTAGPFSRRVDPGQTGTIPLALNTTGFAGPVSKAVTVNCNDPAQPTVMLQIKGSIWRPLEITPLNVMFQPFADTTNAEVKTVRITSNVETPVQLSGLTLTNPAFRAELRTIRPDKEFELAITAVPPFKPGMIYTPITLRTSLTNLPSLTVTAYRVVQEELVVSPAQVSLPPGPLTNARVNVMIRNNSSLPLELREPAVNLPGVEVAIHPTIPGRLFTATLRFPDGFRLPAGTPAEMTLKANHPRFPVIRVPVAPGATAAPTSLRALPTAPVRS